MKDSSAQLRLLLYGVNFAPESTGIPKYTGELGAWLAERGHRVDAIAAMPHYPEWTVPASHRGRGFHRETVQGVNVFRTPIFVPTPPVGARDRIRLELSFLKNSLRYWLPILFRRRKYDAVVAICPSLQSGFYPWLYRKLRGVPSVFHVQDFQVEAALDLGVLRQPRVRRILLALESFLLRRASRVSTISEPMRRRLRDKGVSEDESWLVPNWADTQAIRPTARDNEFRRSVGATEDTVLVQCAGSMGEKQGLEIVLEAANRLRAERQLRFVLIGDGSAGRRLRHLAAEMDLPNLVFLPRQPRAMLPQMLAAADIHLVVQRAEAADLVFPSRLANILASGRPSIVTAAPGAELHRIVAGDALGRVCAPGDLDALVDCVVDLARAPGTRRELGRNARRFAVTHLEKDGILREFEARLSRLVLAAKPGRTCLKRVPEGLQNEAGTES